MRQQQQLLCNELNLSSKQHIPTVTAFFVGAVGSNELTNIQCSPFVVPPNFVYISCNRLLIVQMYKYVQNLGQSFWDFIIFSVVVHSARRYSRLQMFPATRRSFRRSTGRLLQRELLLPLLLVQLDRFGKTTSSGSRRVFLIR